MLFLTEAEGFNYNGLSRYPSRFLYEIGKEKLILEGDIPNSFILEGKKYIEEHERMMRIEKFKEKTKRGKGKISVGSRVYHAIFGKGLVIGKDNSAFIIAFNSGHVKGISKDSNKIEKIKT